MKEQSAREKYADIIDLPHHVSERHPHLSMESRAAEAYIDNELPVQIFFSS